MAKKQKTPTIKEQIYQSVANAQVKQALQNNGMAQFQDEYNAWQTNNNAANSDGFKAFQDEYDNWANAQVQTQTKASTQSMPAVTSVNPVKFKTAEERRAYKEKTTIKKPGSYDDSKSYANTFGKETSKKPSVGLQQIPKLNDYLAQIGAKDISNTDMDQVKNDLEAYEVEKAQRKASLEKAEAYLDPNRKLTKEEIKEARVLAGEGLMEFEGKRFKDLTPEEQREYNTYDDLATKISPLKTFFAGAGKGGLNTLQNIGNIIVTARQANAPTSAALDAQRQAAKDYRQDVKDYNQSTDSMISNAQTQNPVAYGAGQMSEKFLEYGLTNGLFETSALAKGGGKLATFAATQLGENAQDLVLDTLPLYMNIAEDQSLTDEQKADAILTNIRNNALSNAVAYGLLNYLPDKVGRLVRQGLNEKAANKAFADNISEGAEKLAKLNETGYVPPTKLQADEIAKLNENPLDADNAQFSTLMNQFNNEFKDASSMSAIFNPEDLNASMTRQLTEALENNPRVTLPEVEAPKNMIPETENIIPEFAENTQKTVLKPKKQRIYLPDDVSEKIGSDLLEIRDASESMRVAAENIGTEQALAKYNRLSEAIENYEQALYYSDDLAEVNKAKKATDAARQALYREIKKSDPNFKSDLTGTKIGNAEYRRTSQVVSEQTAKELGESIADADKELNTNQWVRDAEPETQSPLKGVEDNTVKTQQPIKGELEIKEIHDRKGKPRYYVAERVSENVTRPVENKRYKTIDAANEAVYRLKNANAKSDVPGADPLQTFADGNPKARWETSKARTNTFENQGWGADMPQKDFAYRVYSEAEQNADALARGQSYQDLIYKDSYDAVDVKAAMNELESLMDSGNVSDANRLARKLAYEGREHGRGVQAFAEYNRNSATGALTDAARVQEDDIINPWKSRNKKKAASNSRIAKALADLGNKDAYKTGNATNLTHDQIKKGVIAEIEKEVGSVEQYFNDNDIEFLTQMAEDKSIPVWQITSEIEHKLNTGNWYTLDESIEFPKPTNRKLQNALNSLVTETIRAEKEAPSFKQITEEVRNTLAKESAEFEGQFTDDDIDYLANLIHEGVSGQELADILNLKMATGSFGISDETLQQVNNIFKEISHYDENSKQFVEGQAEAYRLLANELVPNATPLEKFEAWRYLAMLGNPKTMLRNFIGNQTFGAVTGISNNIAAIAEAGVDKAAKALGGEGIQRTKSILNPITDSSLIKACAEDADASRYRQIVGSKYEKMDKNVLRQSRSVFNSKWAQLYEKLTDAGISDYKAVKNKFSTSLAGYLKANGKDTSIFKAEDELARLKALSKTNVLSSAERTEMNRLTQEVAELNKARDYALKQAEYATFHEDNKIASTLSKWARTSREEGTGIGNVLIEGMIPFKKTPANVLRSGYEYSPFGAISSIKRTGKLIYENTGARKGNLADVYKNKAGKDVARTLASDVIESWAKTLTGTGLTALGFYLHNKGIIHSSDADTKYQDQLEGHQNYAMEINGKSYTIDWAAPAVMPLMVGAELSKLWSTTGKDTEALYNNVDAYVDAFNKLTDPLVETSMLSGVKDTLETAANYAKNNETINILPLLGYNLATGYMTQGIPTVGGQIARTIDPTRRSTYTDKTGVASVLDKQVKKTMNKIPGLSTLNEPYIDTYGREQQNSPFNNPVGNLAYQMLSPGYLANINETGADKISREAYNVNKAEGALPKYQSSFKDAEGNRVSLSDYTTASRAYGQANFDIRQSLSEDEWFNSLDAAQKEEVVKKINSIAEHVGKAAIDPEYTTNSKGYNLYTEGGIPSLKEYFKEETDKSTAKGLLGDSGVRTNSNAGKAVVEAVSNGNMDEAKKLAEQAAKDKASGKTTTSSSASSSGNEQKDQFKADFGSNGSNVYKLYENAKTIDPNTSAATYRGTYKRIDSLGDSNGSVSQKEFTQYLQNGDYTEAEAQKLAKMYGSWSKIPKLENGTWKFKKAK